jgi:hypothetical protein
LYSPRVVVVETRETYSKVVFPTKEVEDQFPKQIRQPPLPLVRLPKRHSPPPMRTRQRDPACALRRTAPLLVLDVPGLWLAAEWAAEALAHVDIDADAAGGGVETRVRVRVRVREHSDMHRKDGGLVLVGGPVPPKSLPLVHETTRRPK